MTGRVLINARVAKRATITGVERWTLELIPRLRALAPERYAVAHPPPGASSRTLGHAWEQLVLPGRRPCTTRARLIFSPANLAPVAWPRNVLLIHDAAPLRDARRLLSRHTWRCTTAWARPRPGARCRW